MCIVQAVGPGCPNTVADSKIVQALLNENVGRLGGLPVLVIDGCPGQKTWTALDEFQTSVMTMAAATSSVEPGDATLGQLAAGMSPGLTLNKLQGMMSTANATNAMKYFDALVAMMETNQINTPLRMAHFLAQLGHESGDLVYSQELASGEAYNGRANLGNTQPGDGPRFKGRGLIQLTGRANYMAYGAARNRDFVTEPNNLLLATDPDTAVDVACWFWTRHGLNALADADNLFLITQIINGGQNGAPDRGAHLVRTKFFLGV